MIYVQLRARVKLAQGETLHVADAAKVLGSEKAGHCSLFCPTSPGVYTLDAIAVAKALKKVFPQEDISLIGAEVCYVHRIKARGKDFLRPVRTAAARRRTTCVSSPSPTASALRWAYACSTRFPFRIKQRPWRSS